MTVLQISQATPDSSKVGIAARLDWLTQSQLVTQIVAVLLVLVLAYVADKLTRRILLITVGRIVRRTATQWDDMMLRHRVFERLAHLAPALAVYYGILLVPALAPEFIELLQHLALAVVVLILALTIGALLSAANDIYSTSAIADGRPIKGYVQVIKIVLYLFAAVVGISAIIGQNPLYMLSGIGAMTAVLLIVFRDTILSFVASLQIASYDMMRVGDWIEMPKFGADGDVVDIGLHTIKVQNWDKTIVAIPTHRFLSDSFKNWRSMPESGGRRIKRAIHIDMNSIRFLSDADLDRFAKFVLLKDYIEQKRKELDSYNAEHVGDSPAVTNARSLTNIGTFRAYVVQYLRQHPKVHDDMTLMVRQLDPTPNGVPLQVYAFSNDVNWVPYEGIQSDIFDHIMAIVPDFGLRLFQQPSGRDFETALTRRQPSPDS
jgi:miniconductance mechanosensitive channel